MPPNLLHPDSYADFVRNMVSELQTQGHSVGLEIIRGEELVALGLNGLYGVGKSAPHPACLVHLSYVPPAIEGAEGFPVAKSICLVGKGITYDTGGLSLKSKDGMPTMKRDMGGSAGVLGAFRSLVLDGTTLASVTPTPIHALLCLAENGIGPDATRPDDIHVMFSGKTVEINNTDAEGRLVLSDGCAYAAKLLNPEVIIDMATLTGAQAVATGKRHAALYCSDESLERYAVEMGKFSGDLAHPVSLCSALVSSTISLTHLLPCSSPTVLNSSPLSSPLLWLT
jgi:probable aminopeptidase NPEPL1